MSAPKKAKLCVNVITRSGRKLVISGNCLVQARDDYPFGFEGPISIREVSGFSIIPEENEKK